MTELMFGGHKCNLVRVEYIDGHVEEWKKKTIYSVNEKIVKKILFAGANNLLIIQWVLPSDAIAQEECRFNVDKEVKKIITDWEIAEQLEVIKRNKERAAANVKAAGGQDNGYPASAGVK